MIKNKLSFVLTLVLSLMSPSGFSYAFGEGELTTHIQAEQAGSGQTAGTNASNVAAASGGIRLSGAFIAGTITAAALAALILEAATDKDMQATSTNSSATSSN